MLRVGIVGPQSSVDRILQFAQCLKLDVIFLSFPYKQVIETKDIVLSNHKNVDLWVFSGKISYTLACDQIGYSENLMCIEHTEAGIFKSLLEFAYQTGAFLTELSIDEISHAHLETALSQVQMTAEQVYVKTFSAKTSTRELIEFHRHLWETGKTKGAITCFDEVYRDLKEIGVPVFRISTSDIEIQQTMNVLAEKIKAFYFKDSQIAVQLFEIEHLQQRFKSSKQAYQLQYMELKLKEILINLSERLNGSLIEKGFGRYLIFCSRGDSERKSGRLVEALNKLTLTSGLNVEVGIGYGETIYSAERNANYALKQSRETGGAIMVVKEDGQSVEIDVEHIDVPDAPSFYDRSFMAKLKKEKISVEHYTEIFALIRDTGMKEFTVKDISMRLAKDERNTRRFIERLCEAGLAECIGVEEFPARGRPRRVYKLIHQPK